MRHIDESKTIALASFRGGSMLEKTSTRSLQITGEDNMRPTDSTIDQRDTAVEAIWFDLEEDNRLAYWIIDRIHKGRSTN